jgi:hypothetical protein
MGPLVSFAPAHQPSASPISTPITRPSRRRRLGGVGCDSLVITFSTRTTYSAFAPANWNSLFRKGRSTVKMGGMPVRRCTACLDERRDDR